eukprot:228540-Lingulodinium_polyedra.AAC.1
MLSSEKKVRRGCRATPQRPGHGTNAPSHRQPVPEIPRPTRATHGPVCRTGNVGTCCSHLRGCPRSPGPERG